MAGPHDQMGLDEDLYQQYLLGQDSLAALQAQQAQRDSTFGEVGKRQNQTTDPEGTVAGNQTINEYTAGEYANQKTEGDYDANQRARALAMIAGEGVPNLGDLRAQAIGRMPVEYSEQNRAAMSNTAANGMAGSGFQNRAVTGMKQEEAQRTTSARQKALSDWQRMKAEKEQQGYDIISDLENRKIENQRVRDEKRQNFNQEFSNG